MYRAPSTVYYQEFSNVEELKLPVVDSGASKHVEVLTIYKYIIYIVYLLVWIIKNYKEGFKFCQTQLMFIIFFIVATCFDVSPLPLDH